MFETEEQFNNSFIDLAVDGVQFNNHDTVYTLEEAVAIDRIMMREFYHNYKDSCHRDGLMTDDNCNDWSPPF